jgi:hypothetical protein
MKKKNYFYAAALALGLTFTMGACSDEDDPTPNPGGGDEPEQQDPYNLDYTADNASAWGNYMYNVAMLLDQDSKDLYSYWNEDYEGKGPYATLFKEQTGGAYSSALACIQEMVESGMWNIANEVGDAKIKDPWEKYTSGDTEGGLYAVESWYSWHSRDDYTNNIFSIRNTYYGRIDDNDVDKVDGNLNAFASYTDFDDAGDIAENSLSKLIASVNPELDEKIKTLIFESAKAIQAIPQPFRNNIDSEESVAAMDKCMELASCLLDELHPYVTEEFADSKYDAQLDAVAEQFVDAVVLPTYQNLRDKNTALLEAVNAFRESPSDATFEAACDAWITAREPWEKSEAFLIGPVANKGLDPNMDSWPLDQAGIVQVLNSQNWDAMEWTGDFNEEDEAIGAAQSVRGYHTLEYLLFKDGQPRTVNND